jgi:hypothetical protein
LKFPKSRIPASGSLSVFIMLLFGVAFVLFGEAHQSQVHLQSKSIELSEHHKAISRFKKSSSLGTCQLVGQGQFEVEEVLFVKFHQVGFLHSVVISDHLYSFHHILSCQYVGLYVISFVVSQ